MTSWELPQSKVEQSLLSAALREPEGFKQIVLSGLTGDDFLVCGPVYNFLREYIDHYKAQPTDSVIRSNFPDWEPTDGALNYWIDQLKRYNFSRKAHKAIEEALQGWTDPEQSVTGLVTRLSSLQMVGNTNIQTADGMVASAYEKYRLRMDRFVSGGENVQPLGIRSTFDAVNGTYIGWIPGELVGFVARPTVGKTWKLTDEAVNAWAQGYRVLFISPEMPANQINLRVYTFMAHRLGVRFSQRMAYAGNPSVDESFRELVQKIGQQDRFWTVDSVDDREVGLSDLDKLCAQFNPDVVCIDGISVLRNEKNLRSEWELMKYNGYGLKSFTTRHSINSFVTHQAVNSNRGQKADQGAAAGRGDDFRMPTLSDAAF